MLTFYRAMAELTGFTAVLAKIPYMAAAAMTRFMEALAPTAFLAGMAMTNSMAVGMRIA